MANVEDTPPGARTEDTPPVAGTEDADTPEKKDTEAVEALETEEGETSKEAEEQAENDPKGGGEEQEDVEEEDPFEHLDSNGEDTEEEQSLYREYLSLIKEIDCQNGIIQDLKNRSTELKQKACRSRSESHELQRLLLCQEQENIRLRTLINRAVQLQNFGSRRLYGEVELEITDSEQTVFLAGAELANMRCPSYSKTAPVAGSWQLDSDSDDDGLCKP
ncbi:kinesin-like protein KIF21B [Drosophila pseudoobscura]|uniref:Kinesin-like protein KIF21B n=1 Tax=Drosophila pseudoobscura pseudoobscura TaxID=46245 RepID=A0A6I8W9R2_DROPS|nr:kinesin-like protein KIF21B [Drosophila pseudoobscura]